MRIAYIVATPFLPTFVANEIVEVQKGGHDIVIAPLHLTNGPPASHNTLYQLRPEIVLPANLFDAEIACLALLTLFRYPVRVLKTVISLHWHARFNIYAHASLLATIPKALATALRLRRAKVDHIHAHFATHPATCAGIASKITGIPFSFTAHAYDIYGVAPKLRNDTLPWKIQHATQVFVVSKYGEELLCQRFPHAADRIHTVYVGIPIDFFSEEPLPPDDKIRLLCAAQFGEKKGIDTLLEACVLLKDQGLLFELRVYGDGPLRPMIEDQILRTGLADQVSLGGPIPQEEVARQMKRCHVFVMPCRQTQAGDMDGIPTVFMEAMATGRPVISCPISGIPELVRDGKTGLLVPPDNPSALAAAIARLACDDTLRIRLGQQARALVEQQHDQHLNAQLLLELITSPSPSL